MKVSEAAGQGTADLAYCDTTCRAGNLKRTTWAIRWRDLLSFDGESSVVVTLSAGLLANRRQLSSTLGLAPEANADDVVGTLLSEHGASAISRLNGDFSFVAWDRGSGELLASRDRVGMQNIFFRRDGDGVRFSTSAGPLLESAIPSIQALQRFLEGSLDGTVRSFWEGVESVPRATLVKIGRSACEASSTWEPAPRSLGHRSPEKYVESFSELMTEGLAGVLIILGFVRVAPAQKPDSGNENFCYFPSSNATDGRMFSFGNSATSTFDQLVQLQVLHFQGNSTCVRADGRECLVLSIFDGDTSSGGLFQSGNAKGHWDVTTESNGTVIDDDPTLGELKFELYYDPNGDGSSLGGPIGSWYGNNTHGLNETTGPTPFPNEAWNASFSSGTPRLTGGMPDNGWWDLEIVVDPSLADQDTSGRSDGISRYRMMISFVGPSDKSIITDLKAAVSVPNIVGAESFGFEGALRSDNDIFEIYDIGNLGSGPRILVDADTAYDGTWDFNFIVPPGATEATIFDGDFDHGHRAGDPLVAQPSLVTLLKGLDGVLCDDTDDPNTEAGYVNFPSDFPFVLPLTTEGAVNGEPGDDDISDYYRRGETDTSMAALLYGGNGVQHVRNRIGCIRYELIPPEDPLNPGSQTPIRNDNPSGDKEWERFVVASPASSASADIVLPEDHPAVIDEQFLRPGVWRLRIVGVDLSNLSFLASTVAVGLCCEDEQGNPICVPDGTIGDRIWHDLNGDGVQDPGEPGINGVEVRLLDEDGNVLDTKVTANHSVFGDGWYLFEFIEPGKDHEVVVIPPVGATQTGDPDSLKDHRHTVVGMATAVQTLDADFGYQLPPDCTIEAATEKAEIKKGKEIKWKIKNVGTQDLTLKRLEIVSVPFAVKEIKRGKKKIFDGTAAVGSTISSWDEKVGERRIKAGDKEEFKIKLDLPKGAKITGPVEFKAYFEDRACPLVFDLRSSSSDKCSKPIDALTMIWNGAEAVSIIPYKGDTSATALPEVSMIMVGDEVTVSGLTGSPNDIIWEIFSKSSGAKIGESGFHLSCSDVDMNDKTDCGKAAGNGKGNSGSLINTWILEGLTAAGGSFDCTP